MKYLITFLILALFGGGAAVVSNKVNEKDNQREESSSQGNVDLTKEDASVKSNPEQLGKDRAKEEDEDEDDDDDEYVITTPSPKPTTGGTTGGQIVKSFTMAEVQAHATSGSCYSVVNGGVYDLTSWIAKHPGGQGAIIGMCGKDASDAFNGKHGGQPRPMSELAGYKIGILK